MNGKPIRERLQDILAELDDIAAFTEAGRDQFEADAKRQGVG